MEGTVTGETPWTVYIVQTESGKLYTGITVDMARRLAEHGTSRGAKFFRTSAPQKVVFQEAHRDRSAASTREAEIKQMSRWQKMQLIAAPPGVEHPPTLGDGGQ